MTTLTLDAVKEWLERPSMHQGDIRMGNISIADILTEWLKQREEQRKKRKEVEDYNAMLRYVSVD